MSPVGADAEGDSERGRARAHAEAGRARGGERGGGRPVVRWVKAVTVRGDRLERELGARLQESGEQSRLNLG